MEILFRLDFHDPVNNGADHAKDREAQSNQERPAPVCVGGARPGGRVQGGERSQPADGEVDAECETQFFALEPSGQGGGDGDVQRFRAHAEDEASRGHDQRCPDDAVIAGPMQAQHAEDHQRLSQAKAVNDEPADHDREDVGKAVDRLQKADVGIREAQLLS